MSRTLKAFSSSDGSFVTSLTADLCRRGASGAVACTLFRAFNNSQRAKKVRRRSYGKSRNERYSQKNESLTNLSSAIEAFRPDLVWGWKKDYSTPGFEWVIYVELPTGQVSFHSRNRGNGPDYAGDWDGERATRERIAEWCGQLLQEEPGTMVTMPFGKHVGVPFSEVHQSYWKWFRDNIKDPLRTEILEAAQQPIEEESDDRSKLEEQEASQSSTGVLHEPGAERGIGSQ